jgi:CRISPR-associated protein Csd1
LIISRLREYAAREKLVGDPAFEEREVRFLIRLSDDGDFLGIRETQGRTVQRGRKQLVRPLRLLVPKVGNRNDGKTPCLLADTIPRVLPGRAQKPADEVTRANFVAWVQRARDDTRDPGVQAVARFLDTAEADPDLLLQVAAELDERKPRPGDWVSFETADGLVVDRAAVRDHWRRRYAERQATRRSRAKTELTCLSCGRQAPPLDSHGKLKGVPGGNPAGVSLISADKAAFGSLGLPKSTTSPVCSDCAEAYTRALNHLLAGERTCSRDNDSRVAYVFWTREPTDDDWAVLHHPEPEQVGKLLESPYRPGDRDRVGSDDTNAFYALSLSGVGGRAMIRDWIEETVPRVRENVRRWFADLHIVLDRDLKDATGAVREGGGRGQVFCAWPLGWLTRTVGRRQERGYDVPPQAASLLFRAAVLAQPLPEDLLAAALRRIRAEHDIPPVRAALIRLILNRLTRHSDQGGTEMTEGVDTAQANPAYRCGRLLAVLARLQYLALGRTNATIVDRFYGAASTAPASVFGQLMHLHHAHLSKLAANRPGAATNIRKDIEEITTQPDLLTEFPLQLSLQDQGRFALGFYHQNADYRRRSADQGGSEGEEAVPLAAEAEPSVEE